MNALKTVVILFGLIGLTGCVDEAILSPSIYECSLTKDIDNTLHPANESITAELKELSKNIVGTQIYFRNASGVEWTNGYGYADMSNGIELESCHRFMIGSISKMYTAVLILQLFEEGLLQLDDPIKMYLDASMVDEIENAEIATIRHLLKHTSGIREYLDVGLWFDALNKPDYKLTPQEKLEEYIYGKSAAFALDAQYEYSNSNYVLLGIIAENIKGKTLDVLMDDYIINPLGLMNSIQGTPTQPIPEGTVRPYYAFNGEDYMDVGQHAVFDGATGDGGISSNISDAGFFIQALFEGALVSPATLEEMTTDLTESFSNDSRTEWYGLGIEKTEDEFGISYGHTGSTSSHNSFLTYYPETQSVFAVTFSSDILDADFWKENHLKVGKEVRRLANEL